MAVYRSRGIVLRSIRYGEADRILDLYTPDFGIVSAIAKGVRRTKSRFGARLEPFSCVEFLAYGGRTLDTLTQAETLRSFRGVREDLACFEAAARIAGYVRALSGGGEADRRVFNLLFHTLDALEGRRGGFEVLEAAFGLKLSTLAGYAPVLDACAVCSEELPDSGGGEILRFAPDLGGVMCSACAQSSEELPRDSFPIPPGSVERLRELGRISVRRVPEEEKMGEALRRIVRAHVISNSPAGSIGPFKSRKPA